MHTQAGEGAQGGCSGGDREAREPDGAPCARFLAARPWQDAEKSVSMPDYPRAWFYPELPWGAPVTDFPAERLRGQTAMLVWEFFLLVWILWIAFEIPYR